MSKQIYTDTVTLKSIHDFMDDIKNETVANLESDLEGRFAANPILDGFTEIWEALTEATDRVCFHGKKIVAQAVKELVELWERIQLTVGSGAEELLTVLSSRLVALSVRVLERAVETLPETMSGPKWPNTISAVSSELNISCSPSFEGAITHWLTVTCAGGMTINVTYARSAT